jgi:hypothetical protein
MTRRISRRPSCICHGYVRVTALSYQLSPFLNQPFNEQVSHSAPATSIKGQHKRFISAVLRVSDGVFVSAVFINLSTSRLSSDSAYPHYRLSVIICPAKSRSVQQLLAAFRILQDSSLCSGRSNVRNTFVLHSPRLRLRRCDTDIDLSQPGRGEGRVHDAYRVHPWSDVVGCDGYGDSGQHGIRAEGHQSLTRHDWQRRQGRPTSRPNSIVSP